MTGDGKLLSNYRKYLVIMHVTIADGKQAQVLRTGTVKINSNLSLYNLLHVLHLKFNLLSVGKTITDNYCHVIFSSDECLLQERSMKLKIGCAKRTRGQFLLHAENPQSCVLYNQKNSTQIEKSDCNKGLVCKQILLLHKRPGHPNFQYMNKILSVLH